MPLFSANLSAHVSADNLDHLYWSPPVVRPRLHNTPYELWSTGKIFFDPGSPV